MNDLYRQRTVNAIHEANRFLNKAKDALDAKDDCYKKPGQKRAAMKRASLDLSLALAELRKGGW